LRQGNWIERRKRRWPMPGEEPTWPEYGDEVDHIVEGLFELIG
jgi:hypothetical protein